MSPVEILSTDWHPEAISSFALDEQGFNVAYGATLSELGQWTVVKASHELYKLANRQVLARLLRKEAAGHLRSFYFQSRN
jgi:hypothetical protein